MPPNDLNKRPFPVYFHFEEECWETVYFEIRFEAPVDDKSRASCRNLIASYVAIGGNGGFASGEVTADYSMMKDMHWVADEPTRLAWIITDVAVGDIAWTVLINMIAQWHHQFHRVRSVWISTDEPGGG